MRGRNRLRPRKVCGPENGLQWNLREEGHEQEQAAELRPDLPRREIQRAHIRDRRDGRARPRRPLVVGPPRQLRKSFLVQDQGDGRGAPRRALLGQDRADVVDRKILFAERDDRLVDPIARRRRPRSLTGWDEERPGGILPKLVAENAEAAWRVPKPHGGLV